jgi:hypothetical protein
VIQAKGIRRVSYLLSMPVVLSLAQPVYACPVCYGASDSLTSAGLNVAILVLLGVTGTVLAGFVSFFLYLRRRAKITMNGTIDNPSSN